MEMEWGPVRKIPSRQRREVPLVARWLMLLAPPLLIWRQVALLVRSVLWARAGFAGEPGR